MPHSPGQTIGVLGAGIAGLVAARVLARHEFACTLIEPRRDLTSGGAGLMLWPSALRALVHLGFPDARDLGVPVHESILRDRRDRVLLRIPLGVRRDAVPHAVPRSALMQVLARAHAGERVVGTAAGVRRDGDRFAVTLADGGVRRVDGVILATGMHGGALGGHPGGSGPRYCGRNSWRGLASLHDDRLAQGVAIETLGRGCRVGLFPVGAGLVYWFVQRNQPESARLADPRSELAQLLADWPDPIPAVIAATANAAIVETPIREMLSAPTWWNGSCLTIGDGAHGMAPDLGRGACTAIVNLLDLDRRLARAPAFAAAAAAHARARRWRTILLQHASRMAGEVRQLDHRFLHGLRNGFWRFFPPLWLLRRVVAPLMARRFRPAPAPRDRDRSELPAPPG